MDASQLLRGIGRGATADVMGGPMDLATTLTNLLVAGGGYAGHKLGLLESPPSLIDPSTVPFTSDWLSKGTPLQGGGGSYDIGRVLPALAGAGMSAVGGVSKAAATGDAARLLRGPANKQAGALYLDKQGRPGAEDLAMYHNTDLGNELGPYSSLPSELTNLSFAITPPGRELVSGFGSSYLVPRPQKLEPRLSPSVLKAQDFYTPRYKAALSRIMPDAASDPAFQAARVKLWKDAGLDPDNLPAAGKIPQDVRDAYARLVADAAKRAQVQNRLRDLELPNVLPGGGASAENVMSGPQMKDYIKEVTAAGYEPDLGSMSLFKQQLLRAPQFRSLAEFDKSKLGAARLRTPLNNVPVLVSGMSADKVKNLLNKSGIGYSDDTLPPMRVLRNPDELVRRIRNDFGTFAPSEEEIKALAPQISRALRQGFDTAPSEYAELKRYGPMKLNAENFPAYIDTSDLFNHRLQQKLAQRGIEYQHVPRDYYAPEDIHELITKIQTEALRGNK